MPRPERIVIEKDLSYDNHTLDDTYPYQDTTRVFQWEKIKNGLATVTAAQNKTRDWAVIQNRRNANGEAPLVGEQRRNDYNRVTDIYGVERYQAVPLYKESDTETPYRYGLDGSLVMHRGDTAGFVRVEVVDFDGIWLVPERYVEELDAERFDHIVFVDRTNQNITTLENAGDEKWLVRSMNPATTGAHNPPYAHETPLGIFVIQNKLDRMVYLRDGSDAVGGFAPYASRFCNGGYIHGVPVNAPGTQTVEFSQTLGTTPRSHMCVRNATSHAKFIYDWAPTLKSLVYVIE